MEKGHVGVPGTSFPGDSTITPPILLDFQRKVPQARSYRGPPLFQSMAFTLEGRSSSYLGVCVVSFFLHCFTQMPQVKGPAQSADLLLAQGWKGNGHCDTPFNLGVSLMVYNVYQHA